MAITDNVLPTALFYCCNTDLRTDIMRDLRQDVATMAEGDLLAAIKRLAVKDESILVHRIKLNKLTQSPGTGVRTFLANLRGQASLCQYKATCKVVDTTLKGPDTPGLQAETLTRMLPPGTPHVPISPGTAPPGAFSTGPRTKAPIRADTPKLTNQTVLEPKRLSFGPVDQQSPTPIEPVTRIPRALARLQPHIKAGTKEQLTPRRPLRRDTD